MCCFVLVVVLCNVSVHGVCCSCLRACIGFVRVRFVSLCGLLRMCCFVCVLICLVWFDLCMCMLCVCVFGFDSVVL